MESIQTAPLEFRQHSLDTHHAATLASQQSLFPTMPLSAMSTQTQSESAMPEKHQQEEQTDAQLADHQHQHTVD